MIHKSMNSFISIVVIMRTYHFFAPVVLIGLIVTINHLLTRPIYEIKQCSFFNFSSQPQNKDQLPPVWELTCTMYVL